ncbi:MAG: polysaccharide biosynthesis/export family protein [Elusimicrobiota bacterium]|nr:polysaccharide biosynthesis/export family protein [Elusimicrobiota bacterium]
MNRQALWAPSAALLVAALSGCMSTPLHGEQKEPAVRIVPFALPPQPDGTVSAAPDPEAAPFAPEPVKTEVAVRPIEAARPEPAKPEPAKPEPKAAPAPEPVPEPVKAAAARPAPAPEAAKAADSKEAAAIAAAMMQVARSKTDYKISSADLVAVTVYQDPDMSRKVRVNSNGTAALPLIGAVKIGGLSLLDAQAVIETKLSKFLVNPQVSLFIEEYGNKLVFVMGEVQKPGSYPIPTEKSLTVLEAISTAGGFTPIAAQDRTKVLRNVGGASVTFTIEVKAITQGGQKDKDIVLEPNDVIYVPQSFF